MMKKILFGMLFLFSTQMMESQQVVKLDTQRYEFVLLSNAVSYNYSIKVDTVTPSPKHVAQETLMYEALQHTNNTKIKVDKVVINQLTIHEVAFSFKNVTNSGHFKGEIRIHFKEQVGDTSKVLMILIIPLDLKVYASSDIVFDASTALNINYVKGSRWWKDWLPDEYNQESDGFSLTNQSSYEAMVTGKKLILKGSKKNNFIPGNEFDIHLNNIPAHMPETLTISLLKSNTLPADSYKGKLFFTRYPGSTVENVPITINVRDGVLSALGAMLIGLLFGILARFVEGTSRQRAMVRKLKGILVQLTSVSITAGRVELREDAKDLVKAIRISSSKEEMDEIDKLIIELLVQKNNAQSIDLFDHDIENLLSGEPYAHAKKLLKEMASLNLHKEIEKFDKKKVDLFLILYPDSERNGIHHLATLQKKLDMNQARLSKEINKLKPNWIQRFLSWVTDYSMVDNILVPLVWLGITTLTVIGAFYEAYVKNGLTFGSEGIYDYVKLIIYGAGIVVVIDKLFKDVLAGLRAQFGLPV